MTGYVLLHRKVYGNPAFKNDVEASAFIYLFSHASWQPTEVVYKRRRISLQRGQIAISTRDLAERFDWSEAKCRRYLHRLATDAMIDAVSDAGVNVITICNYDTYQASAQDDDAVSDAPSDARVTHERRTGDAQNKESKQINEDKELRREGADAPPDTDPWKAIFSEGKKVLAGCADPPITERTAGGIIQKVKVASGDSLDAVNQFIRAVRDNSVKQPYPYAMRWIERLSNVETATNGSQERVDRVAERLGERFGQGVSNGPGRDDDSVLSAVSSG